MVGPPDSLRARLTTRWHVGKLKLAANSQLHPVLGMDIAGRVSDANKSQRFKQGDVILAPGTVGYSDAFSFQTHVLVHGDHCAKVIYEESAPKGTALPIRTTENVPKPGKLTGA
jgi:NADPH:quinone reductase-like Zn-dependent oxidoreductase